MIENNDLGRKPSETLRRVARYHLDKGVSKNATIKELESFILKCDPKAALPEWTNLIEYAVKRASKSPAIDIDSIDITADEIKKIDALDGKQIKRLAFTLLCLAKYWHTVNNKSDYWVNDKDNVVMSMANIRTSIKRRCSMYKTLEDVGMIRPSKKVDSLNVRVCFASEGEPVLHIKDFRNLGYQYLKYCGEPYLTCSRCGVTTKSDNPGVGRKQRYCKECAAEMAMQQKINFAMRQKK